MLAPYNQKHQLFILAFCLALFNPGRASAQAVLEPWGNLEGIRINGQLIPFESSVRLVYPGGSPVISTAKEKQRPRYTRSGDIRVINTQIDSLGIQEEVQDLSPGSASVRITCTAKADMKLQGVYFYIRFHRSPGARLTVRWIDSTGQRLVFAGAPSADHATPQGNIPICLGNMTAGQVVSATYVLKASAPVDNAPAHFTLRIRPEGRPFDGLGGNFRLQNPRVDPEVIDYNLSHLRVAWARVEMPWRLWQPLPGESPLDSAAAGKLPPAVDHAMEMASRLNKMGIPLILSAWFPPDWAIEGPYKDRPGTDGVWGNPLDPSHMQDTYRSIGDYLECLKTRYSTEVRLFSFNESDLGINIRMTGEEHAAFIRGLGAYLASRGLKTKLLLGDNSDATTYRFIFPAMDDTAALRFVGAVSFHSWRGWDTATLKQWAGAASRLHLPLIVAEGSIDAAAWNYPAIFREPTYALKEIGLYTRLLAICQPESILQWQLTSDYSVLLGGGVFGDTGQLRPTQRFWNLKQLSVTPPGLYAMGLSCDRPGISCAALGDNFRGKYAIHIVNDGPAREALLYGLPAGTRLQRVYETNKDKAMAALPPLEVPPGGLLKFHMDEESYVTLMSE